MTNVSYGLVGAPSTRTFRCIWMIEELGIKYELFPEKPHGSSVNEYNPTGKVPVLLEYLDDPKKPIFVLTESAAINTYLGDQFPDSGLVPKPGTKERAHYDETILFVLSEIDAQSLWTFWKYVRMGQVFGHIPELEKGTKGHFEKMNKFLSNQLKNSKGDYLLGSSFTAADILYAHCLDWGISFGWKDGLDDVSMKYLEQIHQRPAYKRAKEIRAGQITRK